MYLKTFPTLMRSILTISLLVTTAHASTVNLVYYKKNANTEMLKAGFLEGLRAEGIDLNKDITIKERQLGDQLTNLPSVIFDLQKDKPNVIVPVSTQVAKELQKANLNIPMIFSAVRDPLKNGLISAFDAPNNNITGISIAVSLQSQIDLLRQFLPNAKNIGILYDPSSKNSNLLMKDAREYAKKNGLKVIGGPARTEKDIETATNYLIGKVDVVFIPLDRTIILHAKNIIEITNQHQVPVFSANDIAVKHGAIAGIGYNFFEVGKKTGQYVAKNIKGTPINELPITQPDRLEIFTNKQAIKTFNLKTPKLFESSRYQITSSPDLFMQE